MDWTVDRGLQLRMAVTLLATAALAVLGAVVTYAVVRGLVVLLAAVSGDEWLGSLVAAGHDRPVAAVIAVVFLAGVVVAEHRLGEVVGLPTVDARSADRESYPELYAHVDRLVAQVGLPTPTVAVTDDPRPLAMTTGVHPESATVVVSTGLLAVLSGDELEAVLAHELAHVRNRDTAVMTVASLPTVVADGLRWRASWLMESEEGAWVVVGAIVFTAGWLTGLVRHFLLAVLGQYRELAADRAAAALTGSPSALASALQPLESVDPPDGHCSPAGDALAAFTIVNVDDSSASLGLGPEGERDPMFTAPRATFLRWFATHPTMDRRLAALADVTEQVERT